MPRKLTPESSLKKLICDWLDAEKIPYWRMNAGDRFGSYKGKKWRIKGHEPGTADLLIGPTSLLRYGVIQRRGPDYRAWVWAEIKAGTRQSEAQYLFQQYVESLGMTYVIVRSLEDLQKALGQG